MEDIRRSREKYQKEVENHMKDFFERGLYRKEKQTHQQEPQELKQEKPQQEPQELRKEADLAAGGGAAQTTPQKGAWTPANPREAGFAGQGRSTQ